MSPCHRRHCRLCFALYLCHPKISQKPIPKAERRSCDWAQRPYLQDCSYCSRDFMIKSAAYLLSSADIFAKMRPLKRCPVRCRSCNTTNARTVTTSGRRNSFNSFKICVRVQYHRLRQKRCSQQGTRHSNNVANAHEGIHMAFQWLESPFPNIDRQKFLVLGRTARNSPDLLPPKTCS